MNELRQLARRLTFLLVYENDMGQASLEDVLHTLDDAELLCDLIDVSAFYPEEDANEERQALWQAAVERNRVGTEIDNEQTEKADVDAEDEKGISAAIEALSFIRRSVYGVYDHVEAIDALIDKHAKNWRMARMHSTDRSILRLAAYELCFSDDHKDAALVINEAVELAKVYGEDDSYKFINAILDAVYKNEVNE